MTRPLRVVVLCVATLFFAAPAGAQPRQETTPKTAGGGQRSFELQGKDGESYEVKFEDELLDGAGLDGTVALIKVNVRAAKSTLIRPRTHFVPELLKSVERL